MVFETDSYAGLLVGKLNIYLSDLSITIIDKNVEIIKCRIP